MNPKTLRKTLLAVVVPVLAIAIAAGIALRPDSSKHTPARSFDSLSSELSADYAAEPAEDSESMWADTSTKLQELKPAAQPTEGTPASSSEPEGPRSTWRFGLIAGIEDSKQGPVIVLDRAQLLPTDETAHPSAAELV
ncbi:MAG: hypothetical protein OEV43_09955, partial [Coriobacteriia bacterium]|nr:hypothetical protein [Coriobacteriia bacterium]